MLEDTIHVAGLHPTEYLVSRKEGLAEAVPHRLDDAFHGFLAARIPYLPTSENLQSAQHPDFLARELFRRFVLLVETIAGLGSTGTVALYILNQPHRSTRQPRLDIWLLVKSAQLGADAARNETRNLWEVIQHAFPTEFPFGYPLLPAISREVEILREKIARAQQAIEFVKFWDKGYAASEAFPHPYRSAPVLNALLPLFSALTAIPSPHRLGLMISLRRSGGFWGATEAARVLQEFSATQAAGGAVLQRQLDSEQRRAERFENTTIDGTKHLEHRIDRANLLREDERLRARLGAQVLDGLIRNQGRLLDMRVTLIGWSELEPVSVIQAVRAALGGHSFVSDADTPLYCNPPDALRFTEANNKENFLRVLDDMQWLEHSKREPEERKRWRILVTPEEAVSLFSLPLPPEFGQVSGMVSQTQPFFLPIEDEPDVAEGEAALELGSIWSRGVPTEHKARIPVSKLDQHILIAGRSGSGKTNTCLVMLRELACLGIPFLVLDPLDKGDYRLLLADGLLPKGAARSANDLLPLGRTLRIYTPGDQTSPFVFNPFRVPPGVTVQKHISQLLRCFLTAFVVADPVPAIYRAALRRVYSDFEWDLRQGEKAGRGQKMPTFRQFFQVLEEIVTARTAEYSAEIKGNIRQMTLLRIGSLLEDNGHILNVQPNDDGGDPLAEIVRYPTVIELGHIGSDEDKALIMAFLLTCLMPHIQNRADRNKLHITVIEEAHRLMRRGGGSNELRGDATSQTRGDFSNILAEVRGYNQGIIVADQSPAELVASVFSNTATHIMHELRDPQSFEMMAAAFVLSPAQANYARHLKVGHGITETPQGAAIHIYPTDISQALRNALVEADLKAVTEGGIESILYFDPETGGHVVSNAKVSSIMSARPSRARMPLSDVVPNYEVLLAAKAFKSAPSPFCAHCLPFWRDGICPHGERVRRFRKQQQPERVRLEKEIIRLIEMPDSDDQLWRTINTHGPLIASDLAAPPGQEGDTVYCDIVHITNLVANHSKPEHRIKLRAFVEVLGDFHQRYQPLKKEQ